MKTASLRVVYFLGIGGIGMSALARYLNKAGTIVHGYDKTPSALTAELMAEGISIHFEDRPDLIPADTELVVYTPAVPASLNEYTTILAKGIPMMKRSELLGKITSAKKTLAVAGTHGKTTVTTMLSHILYPAKMGCTSFLGGIAKNYNSNLLLNPQSEWMVAEADEFDRSFLRLFPYLAIVTATDADHLDIYKTHGQLLESFADFTANIHENGFLLTKKGIELPDRTHESIHKFTYSVAGPSDFMAAELKLSDAKYTFNLQTPAGTIDNLNPGLPGLFNVENSVAAAAAAWLCGATDDEIRQGVNTFEGVRRRFDLRISKPGLLYIDDYAHHPEELKACIGAVKAMYPHRHITGIFQPHLYTRTRDFADGFAESLSMLDRVILLDIYPARELPIAGIDSSMLLSRITTTDKILCSKAEALGELNARNPDILLTLGAGDIDLMIPEIEKLLGKTALL